jgi:hypothetical protein
MKRTNESTRGIGSPLRGCMVQHGHISFEDGAPAALGVSCAGSAGCALLPTRAGGWCKDFGSAQRHGLHLQERKWASMLGWRLQLEPLMVSNLRSPAAGTRDGHVYEFGVFGGHSMREMRAWLGNETFIWGFDSFAGLPPDDAEKFQQINFQPGRHRWQGDVAELQRSLGHRTQLIQGFYNESLTAGLAKRLNMKPAAYVDIDGALHFAFAVLYSWTLPCLHIFRHVDSFLVQLPLLRSGPLRIHA